MILNWINNEITTTAIKLCVFFEGLLSEFVAKAKSSNRLKFEQIWVEYTKE